MWPYHQSFRFFIMVRGSSCTQMASRMLLRDVVQLAKPTFRSRYAHTPLDQLAKPTHSIRFSTSSYSFKLETDYNICNDVKEGVSAIRPFDWSRENIRHTVSH